MRAARDSDTGIFWDESRSKALAIYMAGDYCAEHEWGINPLLERFKIDGEPSEKALGVICRQSKIKGQDLPLKLLKDLSVKLTLVNESISPTKKNRKKTVISEAIVMTTSHWANNIQDHMVFSEESPFVYSSDGKDREGIRCYWSKSDFLILGFGEKTLAALKNFHELIYHEGIVIFTSGNSSNNPFARGGVTITAGSLIPSDQVEAILKSDLEKLKKAVVAQV